MRCFPYAFDPERCPHSWLQEGSYFRYLQTGDLDDLSGYLCTLRSGDQNCTPFWGECPRLETMSLLCPACFEQGKRSKLTHDPITGQVGCLACGEWWPTLTDRDYEWAQMQIHKQIQRSKDHV